LFETAGGRGPAGGRPTAAESTWGNKLLGQDALVGEEPAVVRGGAEDGPRRPGPAQIRWGRFQTSRLPRGPAIAGPPPHGWHRAVPIGTPPPLRAREVRCQRPGSPTGARAACWHGLAPQRARACCLR